MVSTLEQMQVPNNTGPGVQMRKRPRLASRTRCNVLWKLPKLIRLKSVIKSSSIISSQICVMSDQLRVSLYMVMSENGNVKLCPKLPKQAEAKRDGVMNPKNYNFNQFLTRKILMLSKRYESTEVDCRTWLYVPSGTLWSISSDTH